jgi:hypothetical protein
MRAPFRALFGHHLHKGASGLAERLHVMRA